MKRKPRAFILDNFDSFTWNIAHALAEAGADFTVIRADSATLDDMESACPDLLVISPGPGKPEDATLSLMAIRRFAGRVPIMGICLGMQCIAVAYEGTVAPAGTPVHGKKSFVDHDGTGLFAGMASPITVGRYHSLKVTSVPPCLRVTAHVKDDGTVMGITHRDLAVSGVQFHPDSFLTEFGLETFKNALNDIL